jgi:hypothetical protein
MYGIISIATELRSLRARFLKTGKEAELNGQERVLLGGVSVPSSQAGARLVGR